MSEDLGELEEIARRAGAVDTDLVGVDHPVVQDFYAAIFGVAGRIQPSSSVYEAAERLLEITEKGRPPEEIDSEDLERVFQAAGAIFERIIIEPDER